MWFMTPVQVFLKHKSQMSGRGPVDYLSQKTRTSGMIVLVDTT